MTPIQLLQKELSGLEKNLFKSNEAYRCGNYSYGKNILHRQRLKPKIEKFKAAIEILTK